MVEVSWSQRGGHDCLVVLGVDTDVAVHVRPASASASARGSTPPMAGRTQVDADGMVFMPRFPFVDGTAYEVSIDGEVIAVLTRPRVDVAATTEVLAIHPTATEVPVNLLRLYVTFSAPMSEGFAAGHIALVDDDSGRPLSNALLPTEHELWDPERRRLTVLLDPARIKRGLISHRELGYPLRPGQSIRVVIDDGFLDARGARLRTAGERHYAVGDAEGRLVDPQQWTLSRPASGTTDPLEVHLGRPLDAALLARCLSVVGADGTTVDGMAAVGGQERSWSFAPHQPWQAEPHELVVDPVLEDVAGNSVRRVFDRDLSGSDAEPTVPTAGAPVTVGFHPR